MFQSLLSHSQLLIRYTYVVVSLLSLKSIICLSIVTIFVHSLFCLSGSKDSFPYFYLAKGVYSHSSICVGSSCLSRCTLLTRLLDLVPSPHSSLFRLIVIIGAFQMLQHLSDPRSLEMLCDLALKTPGEIPEEACYVSEVTLKKSNITLYYSVSLDK